MRDLSDLTAAGRTGVRDWKARVTESQCASILASRTGSFDQDELLAYVLTGDALQLGDVTRESLVKTCRIARDKMASPSQARRIWPRKAAAVIYDAQL